MFLRRLRAPAVALLSLMLLLSLNSWAGGGAEPAAAASRSGVTMKVGTYNIIASTSAGTFRSAVHSLLPRVDVAGLQEVNSKDKEAVLRGLSGWSYFRAANNYGEQNPVIWRDSVFKKLGAKTVKTSGACWLGSERSGRNSVRAHYVSVVRLLHRATNRKVVIVNVHLLPNAVKGGRLNTSKPRTVKCFKREMRNTRAVVANQRGNGRVFAVGDFNVGWVPDERERVKALPFRRFKSIDMRSMWATERPSNTGTRKGALLDQVWAKQKAVNATVASDIRYSDHRPAIAEYQLPR